MKFLLFQLLIAGVAIASPALQMNKAFNTLTELLPYLKNDNMFKEKQNEKIILKHLEDFESEFKLAGHDELLKNDLFAPSYKVMMGTISESKNGFKKNNKDYALWMLRDSVGSCIDCHTRLPKEHTSAFQDGDIQIETAKYKDPADLGLTYLIVRRFVDAKNEYLRVIQDKLIKKDDMGFIKPFQQILLIELKVMKDPEAMLTFMKPFMSKKIYQNELNELNKWIVRLEILKSEKLLKPGIKSEKDLKEFIERRLKPIEDELFDDQYKPDLLLASGMLSVYFFQNPYSRSAPLLNYWLGKIESELKKDDFLSSAELFLKQCIKKYPRNPIAQKCYQELKETNDFMYSGSRGTDIPPEVEAELQELQKLIQGKKK